MTVERRELSVRGTPIHLLTAGAGPPLLFLHGAGGAGRWLPFQERLATTFTVYAPSHPRSEEHTSELQSPCNLVCRLLLEKKKKKKTKDNINKDLVILNC